MVAIPGNWLDWVLLLTVLLTGLGGVQRGLVFEAMGMLGWALAFAAAWSLGDLLAMNLQIDWPEPMREALAFVVILLVVKLLMWALATGLRALLHASVLRPIDRMLGGAFGVLRGVFLLSLVTWLVMKTPLSEQTVWLDSEGAAWLELLVKAGQSWISPKLQTWWPQVTDADAVGVLLV